MPELPRRHLESLQALGVRLLDARKVGTPDETFARTLLAGFLDGCMQAGLDRVVNELEQAFPEQDLVDALVPAVARELGRLELDGGGPRNLRPRQLADALLAALGLTLADEPDRAIELDDRTRTEATAALASVVDVALAVPRLRETIIAAARERCEPAHHAAFDKIVAQLDERGLRMLKQPKVPIDASHAVQRALTEARDAVLGGVCRTAIDRAQEVIARANAEAAARIDQPVTLRLTPRDVAVLRACDARVPKLPAPFAASLLQTISELAHLAWRAAEAVARPYAASQTFVVGELVDHPKFGRGAVVATSIQRVDVEFADGKHTLVHARPAK